MAYTKIELVEPIYELQEKETERQHYFLELFYDVDDDNLTKFIKSFRKLKKGLEWGYSGSKKILEFNPPAESTFSKWTTCLQFKKRRTAYWDNEFKSRREKRKQRAEKFLDNFQDNLEEELESNKRISNEIESDDRVFPHLKGKGKNEIAMANKNTWDIYKEVTGVEVANTDQNINLNVDGNVKSEVSADVKFRKMQDLADRMEKMDYDWIYSMGLQ